MSTQRKHREPRSLIDRVANRAVRDSSSAPGADLRQAGLSARSAGGFYLQA